MEGGIKEDNKTESQLKVTGERWSVRNWNELMTLVRSCRETVQKAALEVDCILNKSLGFGSLQN